MRLPTPPVLSPVGQAVLAKAREEGRLQSVPYDSPEEIPLPPEPPDEEHYRPPGRGDSAVTNRSDRPTSR